MNGLCSKCNQFRPINRHHVTYAPERIEDLCIFCHGLITAINTRYAKWKGKVKLTNEERTTLYAFFKSTDKAILEAVLRKKDRTPQEKVLKKVKLISRRQVKGLPKHNPLYREDEERYIEQCRKEHLKKMLGN